MLRGLSAWTLKVGIGADRLEHRGAKLDVPMGLLQNSDSLSSSSE